MSASQSLPKEAYFILSQTQMIREAMVAGSFCKCCGVSAGSHVKPPNRERFGRTFGMVGEFREVPLVHATALPSNREWLVIPDKEGSLLLDWAPADEALHDI